MLPRIHKPTVRNGYQQTKLYILRLDFPLLHIYLEFCHSLINSKFTACEVKLLNFTRVTAQILELDMTNIERRLDWIKKPTDGSSHGNEWRGFQYFRYIDP